MTDLVLNASEGASNEISFCKFLWVVYHEGVN